LLLSSFVPMHICLSEMQNRVNFWPEGQLNGYHGASQEGQLSKS